MLKITRCARSIRLYLIVTSCIVFSLLVHIFIPSKAVWADANTPFTATTTNNASPVRFADKNILILYSGVVLPAYKKYSDSLVDTLKASGISNSNIHYEMLELVRNETSVYKEHLAQWLMEKYTGCAIDVVIALDGPADDFIFAEGKALFPNAWVISALAPNRVTDLPRGRHAIQIQSRADFPGTLGIAMKMFPKTQHVYVVVGSSAIDKEWGSLVKDALAPFSATLNIEYSDKQTIDAMLSDIVTLPQESIVYYVSFYRDTSGRTFVPLDVARDIVHSAHVPVFGVYDTLLNVGIIGGYLFSFAMEGERTGRIILGIFSGEYSTADAVTILPSACTPMFDWQQLKRWGISTGILPPGSVVVNRPASLWEEHTVAVVGAIAVAMLLTVMICILYAQNLRRKRAEGLARMSEARYRVLIEHAPDGIVVFDVDIGRIVDANTSAERIFGCSREELLQGGPQHYYSLIQPDGLPVEDTMRLHNQQVLTEGIATFERALHNGEGKDIICEVRLVMLPAFEHTLIRGSFIDITERKRQEEIIRKSEHEFRSLAEAMPQIVWICSPEGKNIYSNQQWLEYTGQSPEESLGDGWNTPFHPDDQQVAWDAWRQATTHNAKYALECRIRRADGVYKWWLVRGAPVGDEHGRTIKWFGTCTDIDDIKRVQAMLIQAQKTAEAASRAKSEFLANMSHEIRTPLNGVFGMLQLLETTGTTAEQNEYLLGAKHSTNRLNRLLSDILDISRIEAGKMRIVEAEFNIKETRDSIKELFDAEARAKGLHLAFGRDEKLPLVLIGDEARLRQILFNLVGNAIKFTEKGEVRVDASLLPYATGSSVRVLVTVRDSGIGIPDALLKDIFEPFVQAEGAYARRFQGAGLGLSIARRLVTLLGGDITIDNTPGEGTAIYLSLPFGLPAAGHGPMQPEAQATTPFAGPSLRILFVEDDAISAITGKRMLEKSGHAVTAARDGQEALHHLAQQDFDLILMDIQMPIMDGVEATKAIRGSPALGARSGIPIVAMTAYAMTGDREKFLAAGMDDYISKPFRKAALLEVIARVVGKKTNATPG